jgi:hypothetical protein
MLNRLIKKEPTNNYTKNSKIYLLIVDFYTESLLRTVLIRKLLIISLKFSIFTRLATRSGVLVDHSDYPS